VSAAIAISGQAHDNVLYIPHTAVFDVSGRPTASRLDPVQALDYE